MPPIGDRHRSVWQVAGDGRIGNSFSVQLMQTIESMLKDYASDRPYDSYWDLATRRSLDLKVN
jgi:hypothetical protein